jgi:hypothetical protein
MRLCHLNPIYFMAVLSHGQGLVGIGWNEIKINWARCIPGIWMTRRDVRMDAACEVNYL